MQTRSVLCICVTRNLVAILFWLLVLTCALFSCVGSKSDAVVFGQALRVKYPALKQDNTIADILDTTYIYEYKDFCLYQIPYNIQYNVNFEFSHEGKLYKYFFFRQGDSLGNMLDSTSQVYFKPPSVRVEDVSRERLQKTDFSIVLDSLTLNTSENDGRVLREAYYIENTIGPQMMDSIILYFDKRKERSVYSLGERIEKQKQGKLTRAEVHFNGGPSNDGTVVPRRIFEFDLIDMKTIDPGIISFMDRLVSQYDSLTNVQKRN